MSDETHIAMFCIGQSRNISLSERSIVMYKKIISYLLIFTLFLGTLQNVGIVRGDTGNEESWEIDLSSNNTSMTFMYEPKSDGIYQIYTKGSYWNRVLLTVKDISTGTIISSTTGDWATARNDHLELFNYKRYSFTFSLIDDDEGFAGNVSINLFKEGLQDLFTIENGVLKDVSEYSQNFIIPEGVKEVDSNICGKLGKYYNYFPSTLEKVDAYYLGRVTNISYYDIDVNNNYLKSIDGVIYSKDGKHLIAFPPCGKSDFKVADDTVYIDNYAFAYSYVRNVECPNTIVKIGEEAFVQGSIKKIHLGNKLEEIGYGAFWDCTALDSMELPRTLKVIGGTAFYSCTDLTSITLPENLEEIGYHAFCNCKNLSTLVINSNIYLDDGIFESCSKLNDFSVGDKCNKYSVRDGILIQDDDRLYLYPSDKEGDYTVPLFVNSISDGAFYNSQKLTKLYIPSNYEGNVPIIQSPTIDEIIVDAGNKYYYSKDGVLFEIVYGETKLLQYPIANKRTEYTIPSDVDEIEYYAFCSFNDAIRQLKTLVIPTGIYVPDCLIFDTIAETRWWHWEGAVEQPYLTIKGYDGSSAHDYYLKNGEDENLKWESLGKEDTQIDNDKDDKDENKFMLNYDANSFTHSSNSNKYLTAGFKGVKDYKLDESYFNKLIKYSTKGEKNRIKQSMNSSWGGSCYGIATTMGMVYKNMINISEINSNSANCYYKLPYPYKDKKLLNTIQYFQLSQSLEYGGSYAASKSFTTRGKNDEADSLSEFLKAVVKTVKEEGVSLFTFATKESGHAVLMINCEETDEGYRIKMYDENTYNDNHKPGYYSYFDISSDYKSFSWKDEGLTNENYMQMQIIDWNLMKQLNGNGSSSGKKGKGHSFVTVGLDDSFTIRNNENEYLTWDGNSFSGNLEILSENYEYKNISESNSEAMVNLEVENSEYFTFCDITGELNASIEGDDKYQSIEASNVSLVKMNLNEGVIIDSNNAEYQFKTFITTDEKVSENENNLISVSAKTKGKTTLSVNNTNVDVTNENGMDDIYTSNYVGVKTATKTYNTSSKYISVDNIYKNHTHQYVLTNSKQATYAENGLKTYICDICGNIKTENIAKLMKKNNKPAKSSIKKIKKKKHGLIVTWKKVKGIKGYELQYSLKKNFKGAKTKTIKKVSTTTVAIKKLKRKKKYYVRIRTYIVSNRKKIYSDWSKFKVKKTK